MSAASAPPWLSSAAQRVRRLPAPLTIALIYLAARAITTAFLAVAAAQSTSLSRFGAGATIGDLSLGWDAQWYWLIAVAGYPSELPLTDAGEVAENAWAFMPVYPMLARVIGLPLGSWGAGAVVVSFVAGYLGCLALHRLLSPRIGGGAALVAVVFFANGPLAALFQVGYAESLAMLFLLLALDAVLRRRYFWLYLLVPVLGFTRPGVLAFALFLGLVLVWRWMRRRIDPLPGTEIAHFFALGALATVVGFSWQIVAAVATGDPGAYLATELAWRRNWGSSGAAGFIPFEGWVDASAFWFTFWGLPAFLGPVVLVLLVAGAAALLLFDRRVRALGVEVRLWSASYLLYLLAVFFPQSSTLRLLFPLTPLWGAAAIPRSWWYRAGVLVLCLGAQAAWIYNMYAMGDTFWRVP